MPGIVLFLIQSDVREPQFFPRLGRFDTGVRGVLQVIFLLFSLMTEGKRARLFSVEFDERPSDYPRGSLGRAQNFLLRKFRCHFLERLHAANFAAPSKRLSGCLLRQKAAYTSKI